MDQQATGKRQLKTQAAQIKRSAKAVERSAGKLTDSADQRTSLAGDRTTLAVERTYAAWVRTALAALASGVGARALLKDMLPGWVGQATGTVLVIFAGYCLIAAVWRELQGDVKRGEDIRPIPQLLLVPMNALLMLVVIAALVGIWVS